MNINTLRALVDAGVKTSAQTLLLETLRVADRPVSDHELLNFLGAEQLSKLKRKVSNIVKLGLVEWIQPVFSIHQHLILTPKGKKLMNTK